MNSKKFFEYPSVKVEEIEAKDVITTSTEGGDNDSQWPWAKGRSRGAEQRH